MRIFRLVHLQVFIILLLVAPDNFAALQGKKGNTFIVAPGGDDINPGTDRQPFATIEAARDAARLAGPGSHKIIVKQGEYFLPEPLELDSRDNNLTIEADTIGRAILYGGTLVTGWLRDGEKFWCAVMPGVKEGKWDFRALVVEGRMPGRARIPESGTFKHLSVFDVPWLSAIAGGWARMPTPEESNTMCYDPKDIPESLDIKNAELRIYHSWDESLVGIAVNDITKHKLIFSNPPVYPPGSFKRKDYIIWNTREGMTKPGCWYLDRTAGRLVYWPLEGEDMTRARIIAPKMERIIVITGSSEKKAENITIRGLTLQATTIPLMSSGMGATAFGGALSMTKTKQCKIERLEIANVGGVGISATEITNCHITDCHVHNIGGAGARIDGDTIYFARNHIHDVGIYYPGAVGLSTHGNHNHIYRNEIHEVPYSGMIIGTNDILAEENLIYRVMREMHDGAAIYTFGASNCILRGNIARDIPKTGTGFGVSSYYLDEGSHDCTVEKNISIGVARPIHNHIARNSIIRDNVFISDEDMTLSFELSAKFSFTNNTLVTPGKIQITSPNAVAIWKGNRTFSNSRGDNGQPRAFTIDSVMPETPLPGYKTMPISIIHTTKAPIPDGHFSADEWTGQFHRLDREPSRRTSSGAPVMVKFCRDNKYLYIGAMITMFDNANISKGERWGKDDGMEISIGGFYKGKPVTYVIRSYFNGKLQSVTDAGADAAAAERLGRRTKFVSKIMEQPGKGWVGEWAVPLEDLGLKAKSGLKFPFNMCAYINEYDNWHCWEGTQGASWQVDKAGSLLFK